VGQIKRYHIKACSSIVLAAAAAAANTQHAVVTSHLDAAAMRKLRHIPPLSCGIIYRNNVCNKYSKYERTHFFTQLMAIST